MLLAGGDAWRVVERPVAGPILGVALLTLVAMLATPLVGWHRETRIRPA